MNLKLLRFETMEQRVLYIFIYYRGHLYKGVAILDNTGTNLQQKIFVAINTNVFYEHCHKV
jgi:hypothetical protein